MSLVGALIAALYLFILLPMLDTFAALVIALAPFYLVCGALLAVPRMVPAVLPVIFAASGLTSISNRMSYDFEAFINNVAAYVVGIAIGGAALALLRPVGQEVVASRLVRGIRSDLSRLAAATAIEPRSAFESRMFDRINALLAQLDPAVAEQRQMMQGSLASLRVGLNILALQRQRRRLAPHLVIAVDRALSDLSAALAGGSARSLAVSPGVMLAVARNQLLAAGGDELLPAVDALYGIQTTLEQHFDFFFPSDGSASPELSEVAAA